MIDAIRIGDFSVYVVAVGLSGDQISTSVHGLGTFSGRVRRFTVGARARRVRVPRTRGRTGGRVGRRTAAAAAASDRSPSDNPVSDGRRYPTVTELTDVHNAECRASVRARVRSPAEVETGTGRAYSVGRTKNTSCVSKISPFGCATLQARRVYTAY